MTSVASVASGSVNHATPATFAAWLQAEAAAGRLPWGREHLASMRPYGGFTGLRVVGAHWPLQRADFMHPAASCPALAALRGCTVLLFERPVVDYLQHCQPSGHDHYPSPAQVRQALQPLAAAGIFFPLPNSAGQAGVRPWAVPLPGGAVCRLYVVSGTALAVLGLAGAWLGCP